MAATDESCLFQATISLDAAAPSTKADALSLLRFDVQVDWHERHEFLKWEIPLAITPTGDVACVRSSRLPAT